MVLNENPALLLPQNPEEVEQGAESNMSISHYNQDTGQVNMDAHEGLRGIAALWIMLFHCFVYSTYPIDFMGSSLMPLFFILSGFTLTICYHKLNPTEHEIVNDKALADPKNSILSFYNNRIVRVAPVYFAMNFALALPLWNYGYMAAPNIAASAGSIVTTATFTSTLFGFILGSPLDGPSWTVQTFMFLWIYFPISLQRVRKLEPQHLKSWITYLYYIQMIILFVTFYTLLPYLGFWPAFCFSTMNPLSRYPLFLMGVYGGEILYRVSKDKIDLLEIWPKSFLGSCFSSCYDNINLNTGNNRYEPGIDSPHNNVRETYWTRRAHRLAFGLLFVFISLATFDRIVKNLTGDSSATIGAFIWLQAAVPLAQLELIVTLAVISKNSILYKTLTTRVSKFFGTISMTIYLIHFPIIKYVCFAQNNWQTLIWPSAADWLEPNNALVKNYIEKNKLSLWGIPIVVGITIPLAAVVFYAYEEPIRRRFKN